jgi:hypothetical protein
MLDNGLRFSDNDLLCACVSFCARVFGLLLANCYLARQVKITNFFFLWQQANMGRFNFIGQE